MKLIKRNFRRILILFGTIAAAVTAIALGSSLYVKNNVRKSIEYSGGAEYLLTVKPNEKSTNFNPTDVAESIYERINPLGLNSATADVEKSSNDEVNIRVIYPGVTDSDGLKRIQDLITRKPQLVLADFYGNPLFNLDGKFNTKLKGDPGKFVTSNGSVERYYQTYLKDTERIKTNVPIKSGGAEARQQSNGTWEIVITLKSEKFKAEWEKATGYVAKLKNDPAKGITIKNQIFMWLDPQKMISLLLKEEPTFDVDGFYANHYNSFVSLVKYMGSKKYDAEKDYLVSRASVSKPLSDEKFSITGNFSSSSAFRLARNVNYGVSNYQLNSLYGRTVDAGYGGNSFNLAIIAGIIAFSLIALILIVNYGLLGALSVMSIALYVFMTIFSFTIMRGEYSPASIAALILGIGMAVDASIITFERLKTQMYYGDSLKKSFRDSNKKSFSTIFDSNITTMIVALVLFYFGTRSIIGLSVTLIISIIFTLIVMVLFTRFTSTMLVTSGLVRNNKLLVGLKPKIDKSIQANIDKYDYMKNSKWFISGSGIFMLIGIVIFTIFALIGKSFSSGFNLSQEFTGGIAVVVTPGKGSIAFTTDNIRFIKETMTNAGMTSGIEVANDLTSVSYHSKNSVTTINDVISTLTAKKFNINVNNTSTEIASKLAKDAIVAILIGMAIVVVYTLIRFRWTYSVAAIVALIHDALFVLMAFIIFRQQISPIFIAAILSVIGYSINDTIVTFDRVREKSKAHVGVWNKKKIFEIANSAIKDTLKRSLWTSITTILAVVILMSFGNATKFTFNLAMLFGLISGTYSSIFIATYIWIWLEVYRQKRVEHRIKTGFWKTSGVEEQIVRGINDYEV